jgi:hypothetical protein
MISHISKFVVVMLLALSYQMHNSCLMASQEGYKKVVVDERNCIRLSEADAVILDTNNEFLTYPVEITYHNDGFLLLKEKGNLGQLLVIDLLTDNYTQLINKGRAENELLNLWDLAVSDNDIYLSSILESKVLTLNYDKEKRIFDFGHSFYLPIQFMRCIPSNNGFITMASPSSGNRFEQYDTKGTFLNNFGTFPSDGIKNYKDANNALFQSDIAIAPDGNHFVSAYKTIDYIDIYLSGKLKKRLRGPEFISGTIKSIEAGGGVMFSFSPNYFAFKEVVAGADGFWVGFIGKEIRPGEIPTPDMNKISMIFHFDWNGGLVDTYVLDHPVDSFTIDLQTSTMYCISNSEEPRILVYKL